ncbi:hypothetical protein FQ085_17860 [Planococcus sp. ANT_H30]|uniref:hypothetical protein n=2 Tax=unclassified Planococcus (in: firmicutes) TaxID=2662419 RepID=UPI0011ED95F6|nr:hypothetical protein [Planococcus sp. ANT_H30]KAA0954742.1 hypothetical protein FQ085_17860 [Planococcus sp. ANT_H30]QJS06507.1 hypothetical protein [Planococcus sp. (in: firmicutes)]
MKRLFFLFLLIVLLFGCSQTQGETGIKTTANDSAETAASRPPQDLEANHTYLDAEILETWEEDGQFFIKFSAWLHDGMIEGEVTASKSLYNALIEFQESHSDEDLKFDLSVDGDDAYMLGIASTTKRKVKPCF